MTLKQLEALAWTVKLRGFAAAAKKLNRTQPAISIAIQHLESEFGVTLIERKRQYINLTPEGRTFYEYAERVLDLSSEMRTEIGGDRHLSGTVKVGVGESIAMSWLPQLIAELDHCYPAIKVDLEIGLTYPLLRRIDTSDLDIALIGGGRDQIEAPEYASAYLGSLQFGWLTGKNYPIATEVSSPCELQNHRIVTFSSRSATLRVLKKWFSCNDGQMSRTILCDSMATIASLTTAGLGIAFLPISLFHREIKEQILRPIDIHPQIPPFHFFAVYDRSLQSPVTQAVAQTATQVSHFSTTLTSF